MATDLQRRSSKAEQLAVLRQIPNKVIEVALSTTASKHNLASLSGVDLRGKWIWLNNPTAIEVRYRRGDHTAATATPLTAAKGLALESKRYEEFWLDLPIETADATPATEEITFIAASGTPSIEILYSDD